MNPDSKKISKREELLDELKKVYAEKTAFFYQRSLNFLFVILIAH